MAGDGIEVRPGLLIPEQELEESYSRSGGSGGQNVNKTSTKVTLRWSVRDSRVLSPFQRGRLEERLASRLTQEGVLVIQASESRSQFDNRESARIRLAGLVREALKTQKKRRATKPTRASKQRRLDSKKQRSSVKSGRGKWRGD